MTEVIRLARRLYPDAPTPALERAFTDAGRMYRGEHRDYLPCDTEYHDIQQVLDVTLAMARLLDGYQRGGRNGYPALGISPATSARSTLSARPTKR